MCNFVLLDIDDVQLAAEIPEHKPVLQLDDLKSLKIDTLTSNLSAIDTISIHNKQITDGFKPPGWPHSVFSKWVNLISLPSEISRLQVRIFL